MGSEPKKKTGEEKETVPESHEAADLETPDPCKTPTSVGPIPIPYPNIAKSSDTAKGTKKVKADGNPVDTKDSSYRVSVGDEPSTTDRSEWEAVPLPTQRIVGLLKKRPVLIGVTIIAILLIAWILLSNTPVTITPYVPE